jgi:hypothetical protein
MGFVNLFSAFVTLFSGFVSRFGGYATLFVGFVKQFSGYKTYVAAAGLAALAIYQISAGDLAPAIQAILSAVVAVDLRVAIASPATSKAS